MRNELLIHSYERARNDQRYADWIAKGGPELRRRQVEREQEAFWRAVAGDADSMARLEREQAAARMVA